MGWSQLQVCVLQSTTSAAPVSVWPHSCPAVLHFVRQEAETLMQAVGWPAERLVKDLAARRGEIAALQAQMAGAAAERTVSDVDGDLEEAETQIRQLQTAKDEMLRRATRFRHVTAPC